jgi:hypothetical protein
MPIHLGHDSNGQYWQWGYHGHKYYFNAMNDKSEELAYQKAIRQAQAAYSHGYKGK